MTNDMEHLKQETTSGAQLNMDALYQICPQCFTESRDPKTGKTKHTVDFEKLRLLLGDNVAEGDERYDFTWVGKRAALQEAAKPIRKTLRPCPEESVDWENTKNLYIEGDNLEVLKLLQNSYMGKVKMIYIDPPYNTGNDFVYDDDFHQSKEEYELFAGDVDEEGNRYRKNSDNNPRFHSDWCTMIYPRLLVARTLLTDDGVIFISIDNNEVDSMKKICDEVFGSSCFLSCFSWVNSLKDEVDEDTKFAGSNLGTLKKAHEYVLAYGKPDYHFPLDLASSKYIEKLITKGGNNSVELFVPKGLKCSEKISKVIKGRVGGTDDYYDIQNPEGMIIENGILKNDVTIYGPLGNAQMLSRFFKGEKIIDNKGQELLEVYIAPNGMLQTKKLRAGDTPSTVIVGKGTTKNGTLLLKNMFGKKIFDYAKPVELINYLLTKQKDDSFIVVDFFSGSATTAHSVFIENSCHNKSINFILVQYPEEIDPQKATSPKAKKMMEDAVSILKEGKHPANICEIGKERIRRAGKKILEEQKAKQGDLFSGEQKPVDVGFRVFKCADSNMKDVYYTPADYSQQMLFDLEDNIKEDRNDLDLLFGCMLDWGVTLDLPLRTEKVDGVTIHIVNDGDLVACFDQNIPESAIDHIASLLPMRVVLRDSCFKEAKEKMNFFEIFKQRTGWSEEEVRKNVKVI